MRTLGLAGLVAGVVVLAAVVSPWVAAALGPRFVFARVYDRVVEALLVLGVALAWRRLDLGDAPALGLVPWRPSEFVRGLGAGLAGLGIGLVACWLGGGLVPALRFAPGKVARKALLGAAAAAGVGLGEEVLFRGIVLRRLMADLGRPAGIFCTTLVYAAVHAIRTGGGRVAPGPWAGLGRTVGLFAPLAHATAVPALAGLFGLGLLLALVRLRAGTLWTAVGVHAAWVAGFRVGRLFFVLGPTPVWLVGAGWPPLVAGAAGWLALGVTGGLLLPRPFRFRGGRRPC
ncbi:MAG TPA: CPBP family glutamic-type intramembrane protease [Candidatus Binatia bacterium]|nr:CPBP family glutamic-type intramembrane protease [Candidatus Binatia bacterium]